MARVSKLATKPIALVLPTAGEAPERDGLDRGVLNEHVGYFARRFQVWIFQDLLKTLSAAEIRISHYSVLAVISANPGLAQSEIAEAVGIEPARLVRVLDELERRGVIRRMRSATDRRSHALFLTAEGEAFFERVKTLARQHEAHAIEKIGAAKYQTLIGLLREIEGA